MEPQENEDARWGRQVAALAAPARIAWAARTFGAGAVATTSAGADSAALLHLIARAAPATPVYLIDTGFLFAETLRFRQQLERTLGIAIRDVRPPWSRAQFLAARGELYRTDPDRCCQLNKVAVLEQALRGASCWISGIRRDQSASRAATPLLERLHTGIVKLNPIADWDAARVAAYRARHDLPLHPLRAEGYTSIGCEPCTARPAPGADPRSGRWAGQSKTECGLHQGFGPG